VDMETTKLLKIN